MSLQLKSSGTARLGASAPSTARPRAARAPLTVRAQKQLPPSTDAVVPAGSPISISAPAPLTPARQVPTPTSITPNDKTLASKSGPSVFQQLETLIEDNFVSDVPGQRGDWLEVEGCWVLFPPKSVGKPQAVVHFVGDGFVGAAPQVTYRLFLETLAARNVAVIATPYETGFDMLRVADEMQYKFEACCNALEGDLYGLPVYGMGHSLGAQLQMLISCRYAVNRAGNCLLSYTNQPATEVIPFLSPFIAPGAQAFGPLVASIAQSPIRTQAEGLVDMLKDMSPSAIKQVVPVVEQMSNTLLDVSQGRKEFTPAPAEARSLIQQYYKVPNNMLIKFKDDTLDESNNLATLLQTSSEVMGSLNVNMRTMEGDHLRPMQQAVVDLPPEVARMANQAVAGSGDIIHQLGAFARNAGLADVEQPLEDVSKAVTGMAGMFGGNVGGPLTDSMQQMTDDIAVWMGVGGVMPRAPNAGRPQPMGRLPMN